jgi:hypothetical protein
VAVSFDRVNHDLLMEKLSKKIGDEQVLRLIRRYLEAGMMADGVVSPRTQGTPQGGPLSPLLSNILLTGLDRELERRGHAFCRYADDCNVYVRSQAAGERVMASITGFLADVLKLTVNAAKSAVARPWERKFLGYSLTWHHAPRLRIAPASYQRLANRVREVHVGRRHDDEVFLLPVDDPIERELACALVARLARCRGPFGELVDDLNFAPIDYERRRRWSMTTFCPSATGDVSAERPGHSRKRHKV